MDPEVYSKIFKAYDIRGVYGTELDEKIAYRIGRAVALFANAKKMLVGRDMRTSSIPLRDELVRGLRDQGVDVVDIGLCSTPMFYWATQNYDAGVMVTASHNPGKYNGFKICKAGARPVGEVNGMKDIAKLAIEGKFPEAKRQGSYAEEYVVDGYLKFNLSFLRTDKPFKIVIDAANGMGGYEYGKILPLLPRSFRITPMFFEPDGTFPNHEANPLKTETLHGLQQRVLSEKADLGAAIDGDGDRIVFIDDKGTVISSDYTTALIAQQVLAEKPGATILYDIRQSRITPETILACGGKPLMTRVGHAFIKIAMRESGGAWGGELSGHFYNSEMQNCENTQIIFFRLLNLLAAKDKRLSELVGPIMKHYAKIDETNFTVADAKGLIARLDAKYSPEAITVSRIDGVRIDFADWWFNVRASNTEPLLRLNLEARTPELMRKKVAELETFIKSN